MLAQHPPLPYSYESARAAQDLAVDLETEVDGIARAVSQVADAAIDHGDCGDLTRQADEAHHAAVRGLARAESLLQRLQAEVARLNRTDAIRCPIPAGTEVL